METAAPRNDWKQIISWSMYDWANSAFATTVMAGFVPTFYAVYWRQGVPATQSTFELNTAGMIASVVVALLAPILGSIADKGGSRKRFLLFFAFLGMLATALLAVVGPSAWLWALVAFGFGSLGFAGANIFYDSLLVNVAREEKVDFVSGLGYSMGYLGGGLLFCLNLLMFQKPEMFGFADGTEGVKASFVSVALWWGLFTVPLLMFVRESRQEVSGSLGDAARAGVRQVIETFHRIRQLRVVLLFIVAYMIYIDGVNTIIRVAVKYGNDLGFDSSVPVKALLLTQFVGFPAAVLFGKIGEWIGPKRGILIAIVAYAAITLYAAIELNEEVEFYYLAVAIGLVQGGVQSLSRSFYARLIPKDKAGEFYGFYNMMGKFTSVFGLTLMGIVGLISDSIRLAIGSLVVLFLVGGILLLFVREDQHVAMQEKQTA